MRDRLQNGLSAVLLLVVLALCASFCLTELAEVDFHWHLLAGRTILSGGGAPSVDDFTYTSRGMEWIDLQWLFEALVALVEQHAGWSGLDWLKVLCITGGFAFALLAAWGRASPAILAAAALPALVASQERFTLRPEMMSFLLLGLFLWLYVRGRARPSLWLAAFPPLLALWANVHALFAVGIGLLALAAVGEWIDAVWRRPAGRWDQPPRPGAMALTAGLALAGTLLTPYGLRGWTLPRRLLLERIAGDNLYSRGIAEFQLPFSGLGPATPVVAFTLLAIAIGAAFMFDWRGARSAEMLMTGACLVLALMARRNLPLFAIVALGLGAPRLESVARRLWLRGGGPARASVTAAGRRLRVAVSLAALACALVLMADVWSNRFFARDGTQRYFGHGEAPGAFPEGAAAFLVGHPVHGEVLNDMTIGGFLASRWYPDRRVFIDGRLEVHDAALFSTYVRLQKDPQLFEETTRRLGINAVLWGNRQAPQAIPLLRYLSGGHGWRPVFADLTASIFVRDAAGEMRTGNAALPAIDLTDPELPRAMLAQAAAARLRSERLDPAPAWLRRILPRQPVPVAEVNAAMFFAAVGEPGAAEPLFRKAVSLAPGNAVLHYDLGLALRAAGQASEARLAFERALELDDSFAPAHNAMGLLLAGEGRSGEAMQHWDRAERSGALDSVALEVRGALLSREGRLDEAIRDYRRLVRIAPGRGGPRSDLALLYLRRGMHAQAAAEIERAIAEEPGHPRPRLARAVLMVADGRIEAAVEALKEAIDRGLDPAQLQAEPAFRILIDRPDVRKLLGGPGNASAESPR